ncbi:MAG: TrbI/VirB10 family protein [Bryobacteraceae bacterium]|jgi:type IV secretory pathway VirB10-like protein
MDEQIDKQLLNAQPKGPFWFSKYLRYLSWDRVIGVLMIGAIMVYAKSGKSIKAMGPQKPVVKQELVKQEIVEQPAAEQAVPARYQAGTGYTPISSQPGYEQPYERTEPATPQQTPAEAIKAARQEKILKGAFASSIAPVEAVEQEKEATDRESVQSAQPAKAENHTDALLIPEGTEIPAITLGAINGEMTGPVDAETRSDVYIPGTREIAIPQGAKLLGTAQKVGGLNQQRLAVTFHRILVFPQGQPFCSIKLMGPALDQQGAMGLSGHVNNHLGPMLVAGAVVGLIQGATIGLGLGRGGYDTGTVMIGNLGSGAAQSTSKILDRYTNRVPTITLPEGSRITVRFTADTPVSCEVNQ